MVFTKKGQFFSQNLWAECLLENRTKRMSKGFFGHPAGLSTLFFTEMWERFSYYGMRAILILFLNAPAVKHGLGFDEATSGAIYGLYTAAVYLLSLPGGLLADNFLGQRKAVWYGGILIMIGHLILALQVGPTVFFLGLAFVAMGTGMLKPNISTMVGDLYPDKGVRRDQGFSIFYMGINTGSFLGQIIVPLLAIYNWHLGFGAAAIGMFFGLMQYRFTQGSLKEIGLKPKLKEEQEEGVAVGKPNLILALMFLVALVFVLAAFQYYQVIDLRTIVGIAQGVGIIIASVTVSYLLYIIFAGGLNLAEKKKVFVIFFLFVGAVLFWSGFEQAGSSLNLFAEKFTNRMIGGWEMPAGMLQSANALFIIIFAPVMGWLWVKLAAKNLNPNTPIKFGLGIILMGLGFFAMVLASQIVVGGSKAGMGWLWITYLLHSIGELALSPVGLSATTKLSPKRYVGQMMGIWFVGTALGNLVAGLFASGVSTENAEQMPALFYSIFIFSIISGGVFILISPILKKWMGEVK